MQKNAQKKLQRNIGIVYGLAFFQCFMVIIPVIVPFFMSKGLSLAQIFYLQAVFATTIVILEAPSGYFADMFGRRKALLVGAAIHGLGYFYLNFASDMIGLMIFEIIVGVAISLLSGADLALLYDTHKALAADENAEHGKSIAHLGFAKSTAEGTGALLGGVLALWSFDLMVAVQSAAAWMCLLLAWFIVEPPYKNSSEANDFGLLNIVRHLLRSDGVLRHIVIAIPLYSLASFHVVWLVQSYWESQGISLAVFGVLWCFQSLAVAFANRMGFQLERRYGPVFALALMGLLPVVGYFGMAWLGGWAGIAIALLLFICRGLNQVILVNALNRRVPSEFRATANSFVSFLFRLSFIISGPMVGWLTEAQGMTTTLNMLGLCSILLFVLVMSPLIQSVRQLQQQATAC